MAVNYVSVVARVLRDAGLKTQLASLISAALLSLSAISPALAEDVVRFGAALSLTGSKATEGRLVKDGYDFYVKHVNEKFGGIKVGDKTYKVEIVYYDDESDPKTSTKLAEKLIVEDKVNFLLGPYSSGATFPASSVAEKYRVPMVEAHGASTTIFERGYKYIFATLNSVDQYTSNIIKIAAEKGAKTVALINENALFPQLGIDGAESQAKDAGLEVVYKQNYPSGTTDFSSMLASAADKKPDVMIFGGYSGDMIVLAKQANELNIKVKMMGFLLGPTLPGFIENLGDNANYVLEPVQWSSNMPWKDELFGYTAADFAELFKRDFGYEPDYHPPQSSAALIVYHHAIQKVGGFDPQKVRDAIAETDIMTFYGPVRFNEKGQNIGKSMAVIQIQNQKPVVVYPAEHAQADLVYPIPGN